MSRFFSKKYNDLVPYVPGEQPKKGERVIKLNTNENPFPPSPRVLRAVNKREVSLLRRYSDPTCDDFLAELAKTYKVKKENCFASNGSDEALAFAFMAFCGKGVAIPDISYGFYPVYADLFGIKKTVVPLNEQLEIVVDDYEKIKPTVVIANPNAPTGICLPVSEIERLVRQDKGRLVVVDEAYVDFGGESAIELTKRYDNLLVISTFSKSRNLAGARLGYAIGDEALIRDLNTIKFSFNPYNVNSLTLAAGRAALKDKRYFEKCCKAVAETREYTRAELKKIGFASLDSKANLIFVKCPESLSGEEYYLALKKRGIIVRYLNGERIKSYVRISIGTKAEMDALIEATKQIIRGERL